MPEDRRTSDDVTVGLIRSVASICHALRQRPLHTEAARRALADLRSDPDVQQVLVNEKREALPPPHLSPSPPSDSPHSHTLAPPPSADYASAHTGASGRAKQPILLKTPETLDPTIEEIVTTWNQTLVLPRVNTLGKRIALVVRALRDEFWRDHWKDGIKRLYKTPFCMGKNSRKWQADFEWFCNPVNLDKLLAGKYDNLPSTSEPSSKDYAREEI